jgi:hypothetical protein
MRKLILAALALTLAAAPATAATWQTTCSNALITAGFCPPGSVGQPVVILGWGFAPEDAQRLAATVCAERNHQPEDPLTCRDFADRELRLEIQERVKAFEVRVLVEAERQRIEGEVEAPPADGKRTSETGTREPPVAPGERP